MSKWEMVQLGDVCDVRDGTHASPKYVNQGYPLVTSKNVTKGYLDFDNVSMISQEDFDEINKRSKVDVGDIIMPMIGTIGQPIVVQTMERPFAIKNVALIKFSKCDNAHNEFIRIVLESPLFSAYIDRLSRGGTQKFIALKDIRSFKFPLPPLVVQLKIAGILNRASAFIEKRKAQTAKLDLLIKSQFIQMFGDPVINPMGWEVKRLGDLVKVRSSKRVYQREQTTSGVPFLRISDLVDKIAYNLDTNNLYISDELYDIFLKDGVVPSVGDILVTSRGSLGLCYVVNEHDRFYFQDGMISWLNKRDDIIDSIYLSYLFLSSEIKRQIGIASAGSTVHYLSLSHLENFSILYPPLELQKRFAEFVKHINYHKTTLNMQITHLKKLYNALMQRCFNGEMF